MKLLYKTQGNSSPQGKPRVYYTGHPEDMGIYFGEIADDILKSQNCAIYYDAEPGRSMTGKSFCGRWNRCSYLSSR